ncbi:MULTISPECIES: hypothetical protein [unclassified Leptolyngbya]|uniref:hypothetical protein n=1 Tax=unclassified Leptolyngbya TaxID=2650499 RepID=UPI001682D5E2|nr:MULTISPECIES: hypothetical protein [unclassified Leptolyngbya]MBD1914015.1 hypothetical protein [Leptolyngbya sp. FACHB-8]MBD2154030.1 hypothetical protein [Leptolyngbya sp. FACHB-16]
MRFKPLALSTLAVFALQEVSQKASAIPSPDSTTGSKLNALDPDSDIAVEISPEVSVAPPELPAPDKGLAKAVVQPLASTHVMPEMTMPMFSPLSVSASMEQVSASEAPILISQVPVDRDVYVLPVATTVTYGEPIPIAEDDPLNQFPVGSYHMATDQTVRRGEQENTEQTGDEYVMEIRSCLAANPDLFRIRQMDGELVLVPILFNGQRGMIVGDASGRPMCPSDRSSLTRDNSRGVNIHVPAPEGFPPS